MMKSTDILVAALVAVLLSACGGQIPYEGVPPDEIFNIGLQHYEQENWEEGIAAFERVLIAPGFSRAPEARIYIARSYFNAEQYILARSEFQRILDRYPADTIAPHASLGVCRSYARASPIVQRDQTPTRNAWQQCGNVARDYAGTRVGVEAARVQLQMYEKLAEADYKRGQHYMRRGLYDSAIIYYEDVLAKYPDSDWAPWAIYRIIEAFEEIGYVVDAEQYRERLLEEFPDSEPADLISGVAIEGDGAAGGDDNGGGDGDGGDGGGPGGGAAP